MDSCLVNSHNFDKTNTIVSQFDLNIDLNNIRKYLLALLFEDKYFSIQKFSDNTKTYTQEHFYYFLKRKINWQKIFCRLAKLVFTLFSVFGFYLAADSIPLKQDSEHNNEIIELYLTNGTIYIPLLFDVWVSPEKSRENNYRTKQEILMNMLKKFQSFKIPVNTIMFDSLFNSKDFLEWLNENEFNYITGIKPEMSHRISKQKLGIDKFPLKDWEKFINHVGFVCLSYSLLTILHEKFAPSIGDIKFNLQDEICGISRFANYEQKLAS